MRHLLAAAAAFLLVTIPGPLRADDTTASFAAYLKAHRLTFKYISSAEGAAWVEDGNGGLALGIPERVRPVIAVMSGRGAADAAALATIRGDLDNALGHVLAPLGIGTCSAREAVTDTKCHELDLRVDFAWWQDFDVIGGGYPGNEVVLVQGKYYQIGCWDDRDPFGHGAAVAKHLRFTLLSLDDRPPGERSMQLGPALDFGPVDATPRPTPSLTEVFERCIPGSVGVPTLADVPQEDFGDFLRQNLATLRAASRFLTREQRTLDIPELEVNHALKKALGNPDLLAE